MTTTIPAVVMLFFMASCSDEKPEKIEAIINRSTLPKLHANEITTLISDSGITRYRISAPTWDVFDKSNQPYWEFPNGIHFERFNENLKVDANLHSNYARFLNNEKLWELRGNVKMTNIKGELFETEQLFWDQQQERIYSDSLIKITQTSRILTGIGFESDQTMTIYSIRKPQGIFPVDESKESTTTPAAPAN